MSYSAKTRLHRLTTKPRRVEVKWIDSTANAGWNDASQLLDDISLPGALDCWTVGYLVDDGPDSITIALSYMLDARTGLHDQYGDTLTIPRVAIVDGPRDLRR